MFCTNCGKKISESATFCTECGKSTAPEAEAKMHNSNLDHKWWLRLAKVVYIGLYIVLPFLLIIVWDENSYYPEDAFWLTLITFVVYVVSARLIKITFLYIAFAQKPRWKKEFKKFF
tara:strand:+ start:934 stop:1284 length:351 start_codon:yes stop_codon:yes gene_type:complete